MTILARILAHEGEGIAVVAGDRATSYSRLLSDVRGAARLLAGQGVGVGTRLGIRAGTVDTGQSYTNWVFHLAAMWVGARHVTLIEDVSVADSIAAGMVEVVVGSADGLKKVPATFRKVLVDRQTTFDHNDPNCTPPLSDDQAVRLNLTSGTTGRPKFVAWSASMIAQRVEQITEGLAFSSTTKLYPLIQLRATAGFRYPLGTWANGGAVYLPDAPTPKERDAMALDQSDLVICSPSQLEDRLRAYQGNWAGRDDRTMVVLGGRVGRTVRNDALARACNRVMISYGATETGSIATGDAEMIDRHAGAVGFLRKGVIVEILSDDGRKVAPGDLGRIRVRTPSMVQGYEASASPAASDVDPFDSGWFLPGDVGCLFEDGLLAVEGRASDTFNIGGWKVNAVDLEHRMRVIRGVQDICACVLQLGEGDLLTFAIVCRDERDLIAIANQIKSMLPTGRRFHVARVRALPRNAMGKIPRAMIGQKLTQAYDAKKQNVANG